MGLDQYAYKTKQDLSIDHSDTEEDVVIEKEEIMYWRKHNRLEGWMANLWESRGNDGTFNCEYVELDESDLDSLEQDVHNASLPKTEGFFFGGDSYTVEYKNQLVNSDLAFIQNARQALADGFRVFYTSWW